MQIVVQTQTDEDEAPAPKEEAKVIPLEGTREWIHYWSEFEGNLPTPIDVSITGSYEYWCPELKWLNFDVYPHKVKITNTGFTDFLLSVPSPIGGRRPSWLSSLRFFNQDLRLRPGILRLDMVLGAKWRTERPYLEGGPFLEKHVLSQIHFHWGADMMAGSEHTVDERRYPGEMQATFFRAEYLSQKEALKHPDGVVMVCYMIKYGVNPDDRLHWIIEGFPRIRESKTSTRVGPYPMSRLLPMFFEDYFLYWGNLKTVRGDNYTIRWLVPRTTLFASLDQMKEFRKLCNPWDEPNLGNSRPLQEPEDRHVFFINRHWCQYNSLLPIPRIPEESISELSRAYQENPWMLPPQNVYMLPEPEEEVTNRPDEEDPDV